VLAGARSRTLGRPSAGYFTRLIKEHALGDRKRGMAKTHTQEHGLFPRVLTTSTLIKYGINNADLHRSLTIALANAFKQLPSYFDISLDLAGRSIISSNSLEGFIYRSGGKGGGQYWVRTYPNCQQPIFATASKIRR